MAQRQLRMKVAKPERVWAVLALTVFSAGMASSAARNMDHFPLLAVAELVVTVVLVVLLFGEVRTQESLSVPTGSRWTGRAVGNVLVLGAYAGLTLAAAIFGYVPDYERFSDSVVGPVYAALCAYFVVLRCRMLPGRSYQSVRLDPKEME
jgi:hypothetical protein